ncbi:MAG: YihY/virulence factor BrkB family protein [Acidobacteriota bacterium]
MLLPGELTAKNLAKELWLDLTEINLTGGAAELAYYFILALFPMLIFLTSLVGFLPNVRENIFFALAKVTPGEASMLIGQTLNDVVINRSGGLLSFGVLGALWAGSGGVSSLINGLNAVYRVKEGRSFVRVRLISIGLTALISVLVIGGTLLVTFGGKLVTWLAIRFGMTRFGEALTGVTNYTLSLILVTIGIAIIYRGAPNVRQKWRWVMPGAVFSVAAIIILSFLFSIYVRYAPSYSATYGSLGAAIVLLLWLYLVGLVLLFGGDINAKIREAAEKPVVEKE